jgi:hypothetical protein
MHTGPMTFSKPGFRNAEHPSDLWRPNETYLLVLRGRILLVASVSWPKLQYLTTTATYAYPYVTLLFLSEQTGNL